MRKVELLPVRDYEAGYGTRGKLVSMLKIIMFHYNFLFVSVKGGCRTEFRVKGSAKHVLNKQVDEFVKMMAGNLNTHPKNIILTAQDNGSIMLGFIMPEMIIPTLRDAAKADAPWLRDAGVLGVHIEGEEYVSLTPSDRKGNSVILFC